MNGFDEALRGAQVDSQDSKAGAPTPGYSPDADALASHAVNHTTYDDETVCLCGWQGEASDHPAHVLAELREAGWVLVRADDVLCGHPVGDNTWCDLPRAHTGGHSAPLDGAS